MALEQPNQAQPNNITEQEVTWHNKKVAAIRMGVYSSIATIISMIIQSIIHHGIPFDLTDGNGHIVNGWLLAIIVFIAGFYLLLGYCISLFFYSKVSSQQVLKKNERILLIIVGVLMIYSILGNMGTG